MGIDDDFTAIRFHQADDVFEQHTLATAAATEDHRGLAALDFEIDAAQHLLVAEALVQVTDADVEVIAHA